MFVKSSDACGKRQGGGQNLVFIPPPPGMQLAISGVVEKGRGCSRYLHPLAEMVSYSSSSHTDGPALLN